MNRREKGAKLFAKLRELERKGELSKAYDRYGVARLVGYTEEKIKTGYAWVSGMIKRGHVEETVRGFTSNGTPISEYHIVDDRDKTQTAKPTAGHESKTMGREPEMIKVEIIKGDTTVKIEFLNSRMVENLITTMLKGE